jgi:two-component system CheB/CheR fusion protein
MPPFPIVGIGASAGGLEAFTQLLGALPRDTGMAYVIIQHLDPKHASQLPQVLARTTTMPVLAITHGLRVKPNHVYVIPPNVSMTIEGGVLLLAPRVSGDRVMPIDRFLSSLAETHDGLAIGVILSGTGSDGTVGLQAIKAGGGLTFVQDERSAKHGGMPHSAAGVADFVLRPSRIAAELAQVARRSYGAHTDGPVTEPGLREGVADIASVLRALRAATGVDFSRYKGATVRRRLARRMFLLKLDDVGEYARRLREKPDEAQALHDEILIHVTGFFRDTEGFEALKQSVFPSLVRGRAEDDPIRIWVPGCATGEEAYSLLICLMEVLAAEGRTFPIQMFATDLSAAAITRARAGGFPATIEAEISAERLQRFFVQADGRYHINKAIRDSCVFAQHDLTRHPPFSKLDLISCCNVMIYLDTALQDRLIPLFHYALKPTGFLKLGPSETVGRFTNLFSTVDKKHKIYASRPGASAYPAGLAIPRDGLVSAPAGAPVREAGGSSSGIEREADRLVLGRYAPVGVVVNAAMEIVQVRGRTGPYLEATPGSASLNLFRMAREGLQGALRQSVQQAVKRGTRVRTEGVRIKTNGGTRDVSIEVLPMIGTPDDAARRHYLILFFEATTRPTGPAPKASARERAPRPRTAIGREVASLTRELAEARRRIQATSEEHEAAVEELRAATEEAQSSNEELQSANEELETSKEEIQATNEELSTVNDELSNRNVELRQLSDDLGNVLASTHIPIIMVTPDLRIRRVTPITERVLNVAPSDVGRPIGNLRLSVDVPDLEVVLRDAIETLTIQEREVQARDGRWYLVRARPYRTSDNRIDGAVLSYVDVDDMKRNLEATTTARDQAQAIIETVREPLVILHDLRVVTANRSFYTTFRTTPEQTERRSLLEISNRQWDSPRLRMLLEKVVSRDEIFEDFEVEQEFEGIGRRTMLLNARRVLPTVGESPHVLLAIEDVTEARRLAAAEATLQGQAMQAEAGASRAKDRFIAILSHELRTPLNAMLGWSRMIRSKKLAPAATEQAMEVIERNATLQARLIEDLLDVSRIIAGTMDFDTRPLIVAPAVRSILTTMRPEAGARGVQLEAALDEQAGAILGDPARFQQIVGNLVSNAIKFTPRGGRIDVRLARRGSTVEISVADTGDGIAPERLAGIFDTFGVVHSTTRAHGGLGLGLAIVRQLVELHGGKVKAESAGLGQGSRFTVTLPVTEEQPDADAEIGPASARVAAADHPTALEGIRVLVVDDEADARELMRAILAQFGAAVTVAATARAALETLKGGSFDVLVSDIAMPGEDGYDLIRKVRALDPRQGGWIPALALTAYARVEDRLGTIAAGYQEHAAKPIEPGELVSVIATLAQRGPS